MSASSVPMPQGFFHAVLAQLAREPEGVRRRDLYDLVADATKLTPAQRAERSHGLTYLRYRHRIGWSIFLLKNAGLVHSPASGILALTQEGAQALAQHSDGFSEEDRRSISRKASAASRPGTGEATPEVVNEIDSDSTLQQPPEERIDESLAVMRNAVAAELLGRILQAQPSFFETLVLDLLHALGYGTNTDDLQHVGSAGDGGIDGIISLDKLGFEKVFIQAKRWQGSVGRPEVQAFFGALAGRRAKKGVFITTSTFTREAETFAAQVADSIVLIDGERLTKLMIDHGVAVTHYRTINLPRVDGDYFES